jgi:hypothetical protein
MAKHVFVVRTNAVEGRGNADNDWYTKVHLDPLWPFFHGSTFMRVGIRWARCQSALKPAGSGLF